MSDIITQEPSPITAPLHPTPGPSSSSSRGSELTTACLPDRIAAQADTACGCLKVIFWILPCGEDMHLSIDCKPEVAGSLARISGHSVARTYGSARSPKEAAENTGPCLEWRNAFWFSCFLACI